MPHAAPASSQGTGCGAHCAVLCCGWDEGKNKSEWEPELCAAAALATAGLGTAGTHRQTWPGRSSSSSRIHCDRRKHVYCVWIPDWCRCVKDRSECDY